MTDPLKHMRSGGTHEGYIWAAIKDNHYNVISLDTGFTPKDTTVDALKALGFEVVRVKAIMIVKLDTSDVVYPFVEDESKDKFHEQ